MKKILLSGGGTAGSVSPLLAIVDEIRSSENKNEYEFLWIGTRNGIERKMVEKEKIGFKAIYCGKLRRYFSWKNILDVALLKVGFWQSLFILMSWRPDLVLSAGGFVSVPIAWAAWCWRIPVIIHQQDARPGLANKLMAPFAKTITVTFEKSLKDYGKKAVWIGNPVRKYVSLPNNGNDFNLKSNLPTILIVGGGTGATYINSLMAEALTEILKFSQIIHVTGKNKSLIAKTTCIDNYHQFEFLAPDQMAEAMQKADLVITRAGMSFLSELALISKPIIIIPIPETHQEDNARIFEEAEAAIVLKQPTLTAAIFIRKIEALLSDPKKISELKNNIFKLANPRAAKEMVKIILKTI